MSSVNDIRATFLDYFAKNGHEIVASSSIVPENDPTLLVIIPFFFFLEIFPLVTISRKMR